MNYLLIGLVNFRSHLCQENSAFLHRLTIMYFPHEKDQGYCYHHHYRKEIEDIIEGHHGHLPEQRKKDRVYK